MAIAYQKNHLESVEAASTPQIHPSTVVKDSVIGTYTDFGANWTMRADEHMQNHDDRSQKNYRSLLQAMSRPGRVVCLEALDVVSPLAAAIAVAECLLDSEVSFCVIGNGGAQALQTSIIGATGARLEPQQAADFVFFSGVSSRGGARLAKRGCSEFPEEGATLVYCVDSLPAGVSERFRVRLIGPGISGSSGIVPEMRGIPLEEFQELMIANADYPLGVDALFVRPSGELMGLPRSTRIQLR